MDLATRFGELACWNFQPRKDQPERGDQQTAFLDSEHEGFTFLLGGNGCLEKSQKIYDPVSGRRTPVSEITGPFHVWARSENGEAVIARADRPHQCGEENLYEVSFSTGVSVSVTLGHRLLTESGWREIGDILHESHPSLFRVSGCDPGIRFLLSDEPLLGDGDQAGQQSDSLTSCDPKTDAESGLTAFPQIRDGEKWPNESIQSRDKLARPFRLLSREYEPHLSQKPQDCPSCCCSDLRLGDESLRSSLSIFQEPSLQLSGAHERILGDLPLGGPVDGQEHIRTYRCGVRHSKSHSVHRERRDLATECVSSGTCLPSFDGADIPRHTDPSSIPAIHRSTNGQQFLEGSFQTDTIRSSVVVAKAFGVASDSHKLVVTDTKTAKITAIRFLCRETYWDFHVPQYENYWMEGVWHHNSGTSTCGLVKAIRFMMKTEAPRKDCPFWIIAENYEQVCNVAWKEKMHLQGHLDPNCVDWPRIQWYRPNLDWPYKVPLKPKPGGRHDRNWIICFKSYAQGRAAMQGESIGGALFIEQFPWGLLEEVLRGMREYQFTGNKLAEFTPVDPSLSMELREMEENNELPPGWAIYRCNTECAKEAGNITEQWFSTFFGMLSGPMLDVRMKGLFGNFAGAVYPEFNPLIHCTPADWEIPVAWHHRRAIDFGFSIEHPFACVWSCHDGRGRTVIYDEYWSNDTSMSVIDHYKIIADKYHWPKLNPYYGCTYVDHDLDAIRTLQKVDEYTNKQYEAPSMHLAVKNVSEGIEHVKYLLKPTMQVEPGKFEPRLKIVRANCPHLMKEMISYRRPKQMTEGPNSAAVSQDPVKKDDDTVDAMRYVLFSEAKRTGITPSTVARQHTPGSVPIDSRKFNRKPPRRDRIVK